jgi:preprotein translocase subunit SecE
MNQVIKIKGPSLLYYIVFLIALLSAFSPLFLTLNPLYSLLIFVVSTVFGLFAFSRTSQGISFLAFAKDSQRELRKVTWPSKLETKRSVIAVTISVIVAALFFWLTDSIIVSLLEWILSGLS